MIYSRTASCTQVTLRMYITFLDLLEDGACEGSKTEYPTPGPLTSTSITIDVVGEPCTQ